MPDNLTAEQKRIDSLAKSKDGDARWINVEGDPFQSSLRSDAENDEAGYRTKKLFFLSLKSIDADAESILNASKEIDEVQALRISNSDLNKGHPWLTRLSHLRFVRFDQCDISAETINGLGRATELQYLVILGGQLDAGQLSALQGLSHIRCIVFAGVDVSTKQVESLREHMSSLIIASQLDRAEAENNIPLDGLEPAETTYSISLSQLDQIDQSLDRIHDSLRDSGLAERHQFRLPATDHQISELEKRIGFLIPDDIRLLLDRHNGQLESEQLVCLAPFCGTDSISERFLFRYGYCLDDFHWFTYCDAKLNWPWLGIPIMGADALTVFVNPLNGQVFEIDGISGYVMNGSLADFMDRLANEVAKQAEAGVEEIDMHSSALCDPKYKVRINPVY